MFIIGVDYHPSFQQIAFLDQETGECGERRLNHSDGEAEKFYRELKQRGVSVRVGMEATGYSRWFERLLAELGFQVWIGDAAEIKRRAHAAVLPEQSHRDATPDNEWRNVLCQKRARSHATSAPTSNDATRRSSALLKAQTVSLVS